MNHPFLGPPRFDLYNDTSTEAGQGISATTPLSKGWRCGKIMKDPPKQSTSTAFYNSLKDFESRNKWTNYRIGQSGSWDKLFGQVLKRQVWFNWMPVLCSIYRAQRMPGAEISFAMRPRFRSSREQNKSLRQETLKTCGDSMWQWQFQTV